MVSAGTCEALRLSLTFAYPSRVIRLVKPELRAKVWPVTDAVSVNILDYGAAQLADEARKARVSEIRTHSYLGGTYAVPGGLGQKPPRSELDGASTLSLAGARDRGSRDALAACTMGATAHEVNGEAGLYRGEVRRRAADGTPTAWHARKDVPALLDAYLDGWSAGLAKHAYGAASVPVLWDLRFGIPTKFYPAPPEPSQAWRDACCVRSIMAYATDDDEGRAKNLVYYNDILDRVEGLTPLPINLIVGSGRVAGPGNVVGSDEALESLVQTKRPRLSEISAYIGAGAEGQLAKGHAEFEAILTLWPRLRKLAHSAAARTGKAGVA